MTDELDRTVVELSNCVTVNDDVEVARPVLEVLFIAELVMVPGKLVASTKEVEDATEAVVFPEVVVFGHE